MIILRLQLENWRNFTKVNVPLQQRVFIVGPNASGKSNVLDALRFLQDIASTGGGLQNAVADRGGISKIRCLAARRYSDISIEVDLGLDAEKPDWTYRIVFSQDNLRRPVLKEEVVTDSGGKVVLRRPNKDDLKDKELLTQTHLEQVSANLRFREVAEFLSSIRYLHVVPQLVRNPDRYQGRKDKEGDPYGSDFLEQIARSPKKTVESRLRRIKNVLTVAVPQLRELTLERDEVGTPHLSGRFEHWRPNAGWQREDQFSDGTLRLMGLLWAVLEGSGPLLLEEPELSLNAEVVRVIPQMLWRVTRKRRRQVIITTHSYDLLRDPGIAPDETLLLHPSKNGTEVETAKDDKRIEPLLKSGSSMADAVLPSIAPRRPDQLALFGDA